MRRLVTAAIAVLALACTQQAFAASVIVGPDPLANSGVSAASTCYGQPSNSLCDMTVVLTGVPGPARTSVPADGVITSWRVLASVSGDGTIALRVVRPAAGGKYTGVATSAPGTHFDGTTANAVNLPVQAGDLIGADAHRQIGDALITIQGFTAGFGDAVWHTSQGGRLPDGATDSPDQSRQSAPALNATVELLGPVVSSVSPASGSTAGGETVTITGDHLANATAVTFGETAGTITSNTNTQLVATAPAGSPGTVFVRVTAPGGESLATDAARYTYNAPPSTGGGDTNTPPPTTQPPPAVPTDKVAPVLSAFVVSPSAFRAANTGPAFTSAVGGRVVYRLSEAAQVTFTAEKKLAGRKKGKRCVAPNRARRGKKCARYSPVKGSFTVPGDAGLNTFRFMARLAGKALKPGNYRLIAVAKDSAGNSSKAVRHPFRIKK